MVSRHCSLFRSSQQGLGQLILFKLGEHSSLEGNPSIELTFHLNRYQIYIPSTHALFSTTQDQISHECPDPNSYELLLSTTTIFSRQTQPKYPCLSFTCPNHLPSSLGSNPTWLTLSTKLTNPKASLLTDYLSCHLPLWGLPSWLLVGVPFTDVCAGIQLPTSHIPWRCPQCLPWWRTVVARIASEPPRAGGCYHLTTPWDNAGADCCAAVLGTLKQLKSCGCS